jgi:hypothetical protein
MKCKIKGCNKTKLMARGMCNSHYLRFIRHGRTKSIKRPYGEGGLRPDGYWVVSYLGRRILKHRLVMELHLGRKLDKCEVVHHKDRNRLNNDISNLVLTNHSEHRMTHFRESCQP